MNFDGEKPQVSILCITYNHGEYIRDALDGFLMQKTTFPFEIIVHDDASTDNTVEILKEYESKYPNIISVIYESVNQYNKGISYLKKMARNNAVGKYIATCEGDDFWTDDQKLQRQYDFLESNPDYSACIHNALTIKKNGELWDLPKSSMYLQNDTTVGVSQLQNKVVLSNLATFFFRRSIISTMSEDLYQEFLHTRANGDMFFSALFVATGKVFHMAKDMAKYRYVIDGNGSWSARNRDKNIALKTYKKLILIQSFIKKNYNIDVSYKDYIDNLCVGAIIRAMRKHTKEDISIAIEINKECKNNFIKILFLLLKHTYNHMFIKYFKSKTN